MHDRREAGSGNYHRFCPTSIRQGASRRFIINVIIGKFLRNGIFIGEKLKGLSLQLSKTPHVFPSVLRRQAFFEKGALVAVYGHWREKAGRCLFQASMVLL